MQNPKNKNKLVESSDSSSSDSEKGQSVVELMEKLETTIETIDENEKAKLSAQSQTVSAERLSEEEWSRMTRIQRKNYLRRRREIRVGAEAKSSLAKEGGDKGGKRTRDVSGFTPSPNKEVKKRAKLDMPQYSQALKCPKVAITHGNYPHQELKEDLIMELMGKLVDMMREVKPEEEPVCFSGYTVRTGAVIVNCGDERSRLWLAESITRMTPWKEVPLRTCDPKMLEGFKRVGAFIPIPVSGIEAGLANLKAQNRGLDTKAWKILPGGVKMHPKGIYFVASIPESHYKLIESRNFRINHGFHSIEIKVLKEKAQQKEESGMEVDVKAGLAEVEGMGVAEVETGAEVTATAMSVSAARGCPESSEVGMPSTGGRQPLEGGGGPAVDGRQGIVPSETVSGGVAATLNRDTGEKGGCDPQIPKT